MGKPRFIILRRKISGGVLFFYPDVFGDDEAGDGAEHDPHKEKLVADVFL